jgi:hypothetical protein
MLYTGALVVCCLAGLAGCDSKPAEPPPGAPKDAGEPPIVDTPDSSSPTDSPGSTANSSAASGKAKDEKGEK